MGVAFEPFHLKREREEGYFDSDGNYIQYKLDEVKDAWLDSLTDGTTLHCLHWERGLPAYSSVAPAILIQITGPIPQQPACKHEEHDLLPNT